MQCVGKMVNVGEILKYICTYVYTVYIYVDIRKVNKHSIFKKLEFSGGYFSVQVLKS